jgi:hypothetical protein
VEDRLDLWIVEGSERFSRDPELRRSLLALAQHSNTRKCLLLLRNILETPGLFERLSEVLDSNPVRKHEPRHDGAGGTSTRRRRDQ